MAPVSSPSPYLSLAGLKARGWTAALIREVLGEPDLLADNPHYKRAPQMRLYLRSRVEACEQAPDWAQRLAPIRQRQQAAARAVATKQAQLRAYLQALVVQVPTYGAAELLERACAHYNRRLLERALWRAERGRWDGEEPPEATPASDPGFLRRITVNYLRHQCSRYDRELRTMAGKVGIGDFAPALHAKVCQAIAATYPWLAQECARQIQQKATQ